MSAEVLRAGARLMRERAEAATESPWGPLEDFAFADGSVFVERVGLDDNDVGNEVGCINRMMDAEHIASWHPAVALAVADWLEQHARGHDWHLIDVGRASSCGWLEDRCAAFTVARTYLGELA